MEAETIPLARTGALAGSWPARYTLVVLMFVAYLIAWSDRVNFSVAAPKIMETYGWSAAQMGFVLSAFTWGFVAFTFAAGWLADRYGGLNTLVGGILSWSAVTLLFPFSRGVASMVSLRFLLGVGEIMYPPAQIRILSRWFPERERARVNGICLAASDAGVIVATPLAAWLLVAYGWRTVFYIFGAIGIAWGVLVWKWGASSRTIQRLDEAVPQRSTRDAHPKLPLRRLMRLRTIWGLVLAYVPLTYCFWMFLNWLPTYLVEEHGLTYIRMGVYATFPFFAKAAAQIVSGWVSTYLLANGYSKNFSRKSIICAGFLGASVCLVLTVFAFTPLLAVAYISGAVALLGACWTPIWTIPTDLSAKWPATIFGFVGTIGFLGSVAAPVVTGYIVDTTGSWHYAFLLAAALLMGGFFATWFLVSTDPIDERLDVQLS